MADQNLHLQRLSKTLIVGAGATNAAATAILTAAGLGYRWYVTYVHLSSSASPLTATTATLAGSIVGNLDAWQVPVTAPVGQTCIWAPNIVYVSGENDVVTLTLNALGAAIVGQCVIGAYKGTV